MPGSPAADREIITERLIHAPRELVFSAWTDPEHVAKWWGPDGFTNTIHEMDVRPGGVWRFVMHGPDGTDYQNLIVFAEIVKPERIVYDHVSTPKFRNTVTFVEEGGKTRVTMRAVLEDKAAYEMAVKTFKAVEGGRQTLGRLANFVEGPDGERAKTLDLGPLSEASLREKEGLCEVTLVRDLPHPRATVWEVLTNPLHLQEWAPFLADRDLGAEGKATLTMIDGGAMNLIGTRVTRAEPPSFLEYTWGEDLLIWELEPTSSGTRLTLRHTTKNRQVLAGVSAGWHICLAVADRFMQGRPFGAVTGAAAREHGWDGLNEAYAAKLGVPKMIFPADAFAPPSAADQPFEITRRFAASRALVFKAWSDPAHFAQWWGPSGSVVKVGRMDFRPGGVVLYSWAYEGQPSEWARFVFGRIVPERSIEFVNSFTNEAGEPMRAGFSSDWPMEVRYTVTFTEEGGVTTLTLRGGAVRPSESERAMFASLAASMEQGFGGTFAALETHLARMSSRGVSPQRKIVLFMHASLDGFVAGPKGEMDWIHVDDEIFEYAGARIKEGDTALYGRVTWEMMEAYWPTAADQPNPSKHDVEHSRWYKRVNKVVLSRTMEGASRPNTRFIATNLGAEIHALKATPGKDILIFGSPRAAHSLMAEDLIDGYWIFVNPLLLGTGVRLFDSVLAKQQLRLLESRSLTSGVVCLHYERKRDSPSPTTGVAD